MLKQRGVFGSIKPDSSHPQGSSGRHRRCFNAWHFASWRKLPSIRWVWHLFTSGRLKWNGVHEVGCWNHSGGEAASWHYPNWYQRVPLSKRVASCSYRKCVASLIWSLMGHLFFSVLPSLHNTPFASIVLSTDCLQWVTAQCTRISQHTTTLTWHGDKELPSTQTTLTTVLNAFF